MSGADTHVTFTLSPFPGSLWVPQLCLVIGIGAVYTCMVLSFQFCLTVPLSFLNTDPKVELSLQVTSDVTSACLAFYGLAALLLCT